MARKLTEQAKQALVRIREQMAAAAREMRDAARVRQQLQAQLREVQHHMASPDGITSSERFVEDVSRLRREIQAATAREQEADVSHSRLSAEELQVIARATGASGGPAGLYRTQRAGTTPQSASVSTETSARMQTGLEQLRHAQAQYERNSTARTNLEQKLISNIKKTMLVVFIAALCVAAIADILSFFEIELNLLVAWLIPMISWFLVRRVSGINKGGDTIVSAHTAAQRQLTLLQQRLRPAIQASRNTELLVGTKVDALVFAGKSYISTFARDTIITQLVELVPVVNMLPFYIGQVVKMFIDQNLAYQKVRKLMPQLHYAHQQIDRLEQFEIQFMARQIATVVRAQQVIGARQRRQASVAQPQEARATAPLALGYAT